MKEAIHAIHPGFVSYTLSRGGNLGMVLRSSCLTFWAVNGGYRAFRMNSILEPRGESFDHHESGTEPHQVGTLMVARE